MGYGKFYKTALQNCIYQSITSNLKAENIYKCKIQKVSTNV